MATRRRPREPLDRNSVIQSPRQNHKSHENTLLLTATRKVENLDWSAIVQGVIANKVASSNIGGEELPVTVPVAGELRPGSVEVAIDVARKVLESHGETIGLDVEVKGWTAVGVSEDWLPSFEGNGVSIVVVFVGQCLRRFSVLGVPPVGIPRRERP